MPRVAFPILSSPLVRRVAWHIRRIGGKVDRRFFLSITQGIVAIVVLAAILITVLEKPWTIDSFFDSFNWGLATVLGSGDADFVISPGGRIVGWLLILFGVALLGTITGMITVRRLTAAPWPIGGAAHITSSSPWTTTRKKPRSTSLGAMHRLLPRSRPTRFNSSSTTR